MHRLSIFLLATSFLLTACGDTREERAATGALVGAGAGAILGSTVGAPVSGATLGAGVGGVTGALTDRDTINLGEPFWK